MKKSFERKLTGGNNTNAIYIEKYNNPSLKDRLILFDIVPKY